MYSVANKNNYFFKMYALEKQCGENICRYGLNKMFTAIHWVDHLKEIT